MIKEILIVNTYTYAGGPIVLSELCRQLCALGCNAKLFPLKFFPDRHNPDCFRKIDYLYSRIASILCSIIVMIFPIEYLKQKFIPYDYYHPVHFRGCRIKFFPCYRKASTLVIYPESIYGNPLQANMVARWLLFHYQYVGDKEAYSASDLFIGFRDVFNDSSLNIVGNNVKLTTFDGTLYRQYNFGSRHGNCYILRKGKERKDLPSVFDGPVIDDLTEEEKVKVFNECARCYSYDTQTFYSSIAAICGCISIVVVETGKRKEDYRFGSDGPIYGVAYGDSQEELQYALATLPNLINAINPSDRNIDNARYFIQLTQSYFKSVIWRQK